MKKRPSHLKSKKTEEILQSLCAFKGKQKKGLTLIEVIISMALFGIMAVPVATMVNYSIKSNHQAELRQEAAFVGQKILEELSAVREDLVIGENNLFGLSSVMIEEAKDENQTYEYIMNKVSGAGEESVLQVESFDTTITFNKVIKSDEERLADLALVFEVDETTKTRQLRVIQQQQEPLFINQLNGEITIIRDLADTVIEIGQSKTPLTSFQPETILVQVEKNWSDDKLGNTTIGGAQANIINNIYVNNWNSSTDKMIKVCVKNESQTPLDVVDLRQNRVSQTCSFDSQSSNANLYDIEVILSKDSVVAFESTYTFALEF